MAGRKVLQTAPEIARSLDLRDQASYNRVIVASYRNFTGLVRIVAGTSTPCDIGEVI